MASPKTSMSGFPDPSVVLTSVPLADLDLKGRKLLVIGGTDGLGRALTQAALGRGAEVTVVGRTFRDEPHPNLRFVKADLASMDASVRLGETLPIDGVDTVVLTAGIMAAKTREVTAEGIERDMAVSYLSRLGVLRTLAPRLEASAAGKRPRVFVMGFPGAGNPGDAADLNAERGYDAFGVHMNTVAGNEMLVLDARERYPRLGFFGLNPGLIKTAIRANYLGDGSLMHRVAEFFIGLFMPSASTYAARILPVLFAPELEARSGVMIGAKGKPILPTEGMNAARIAEFLAASQALVDRGVAASARG